MVTAAVYARWLCSYSLIDTATHSFSCRHVTYLTMCYFCVFVMIIEYY
jgi:hypothetical protein